MAIIFTLFQLMPLSLLPDSFAAITPLTFACHASYCILPLAIDSHYWCAIIAATLLLMLMPAPDSLRHWLPLRLFRHFTLPLAIEAAILDDAWLFRHISILLFRYSYAAFLRHYFARYFRHYFSRHACRWLPWYFDISRFRFLMPPAILPPLLLLPYCLAFLSIMHSYFISLLPLLFSLRPLDILLFSLFHAFLRFHFRFLSLSFAFFSPLISLFFRHIHYWLIIFITLSFSCSDAYIDTLILRHFLDCHWLIIITFITIDIIDYFHYAISMPIFHFFRISLSPPASLSRYASADFHCRLRRRRRRFLILAATFILIISLPYILSLLRHLILPLRHYFHWLLIIFRHFISCHYRHWLHYFLYWLRHIIFAISSPYYIGCYFLSLSPISPLLIISPFAIDSCSFTITPFSHSFAA